MGRKDFRAKLSVPISCHVIDPPHQPPAFSATTQDISLTGMQALLPHELPDGTSLKIEAQLPLKNTKHLFSAVGKVIKTHPSKLPHVSPRLFPTSIRFVSFRKGGPELLGPLMDALGPTPFEKA